MGESRTMSGTGPHLTSGDFLNVDLPTFFFFFLSEADPTTLLPGKFSSRKTSPISLHLIVITCGRSTVHKIHERK